MEQFEIHYLNYQHKERDCIIEARSEDEAKDKCCEDYNVNSFVSIKPVNSQSIYTKQK